MNKIRVQTTVRRVYGEASTIQDYGSAVSLNLYNAGTVTAMFDGGLPIPPGDSLTIDAPQFQQGIGQLVGTFGVKSIDSSPLNLVITYQRVEGA